MTAFRGASARSRFDRVFVVNYLYEQVAGFFQPLFWSYRFDAMAPEKDHTRFSLLKD